MPTTTAPTPTAPRTPLAGSPALLKATEVGPDWQEQPLADPNQLPFDSALCGRDYASDQFRVDSVGTEFHEVGKDTSGVSVRLFYARYRSPDTALAAYQELDRSTANCPLGLTPGPGTAGLPVQRIGRPGTLALSIDGGQQGYAVEEFQRSSCVLLVTATTVPAPKAGLPIDDIVLDQAVTKLEEKQSGLC